MAAQPQREPRVFLVSAKKGREMLVYDRGYKNGVLWIYEQKTGHSTKEDIGSDSKEKVDDVNEWVKEWIKENVGTIYKEYRIEEVK
jgi:predicted transcriptional regulator